VTISGTNFGSAQGTGTVSFNGADATPTSWSATSIVTTVPIGATTGNVVVSASGVASNGKSFTVVESFGITGVSPGTGVVGEVVTLTGSGFGGTQGTSTLKLNGTSATVASWSDTILVAYVPSGATTGPFTVTVNGNAANSASFTVTALPSGWSDGDIGSVGVAGSASDANGTFTVNGAGLGSFSTPDGFNFAYQQLSGDGTIVARVVSVAGGYAPQAGVMVRETLDPSATNAFTFYYQNFIYLSERTTSGGSPGYQGGMNDTPPYWVKLVRSGSTFTAYGSADGINWTQVGSSQTISMASIVYIGLGVTSRTTSALTTATFDSVSVTQSSAPAPVITSLSATTGSVGSQVTISGTGFGATQSGSVVTLNGGQVTINSWSSAAISITIPTGATSGDFLVSVAPAMNESNAVYFTVTSQPLPASWLDADIGAVGLGGSATYANGTFTITGAGQGTFSTPDGFHFVYQPLTGDGTIVARVLSVTGGYAPQSGIMIRETLDPSATNAFTFFYQGSIWLTDRTTSGGSSSYQGGPGGTLPYWIMLVRSGTSFSGYASYNGLTWTQVGTTQTISMAQTVYVGLAVTSRSTSSLATATFDSVSLSAASAPAPVITTVSATTGAIGGQVLITGTGFGFTQNGSLVTLNDAPLTINSWDNTSILITIPTGVTSGYMSVSVAPSMNSSNSVYFTVTTQPLTNSWLDQDIGLVGLAGSATYAGGIFTVNGSGNAIYYTADQMHFVYQTLSGDGSIVVRVVSASGIGYPDPGVVIRESLDPAATNAFLSFASGNNCFYDRTTTGGSTGGQGCSSVANPWVKLVRSGNTFSAYSSYNGETWVQVGTSQTITMAQNVFIGMVVCSQSNSILATATMDNVSVSSSAVPAPAITSVSATTGPIGGQVAITGTGFGASENGSQVMLNDAPVTIDSWSNTSITVTIPTGATSGYMTVAVAPSMNNSNAILFTITTQPLATPWLDQDVGPVGRAGSATYASGIFTVNGSGNAVYYTADQMHFVYQPMSGDGSIVARVVSISGSTYPLAGVMIRETLDPAATNAFLTFGSGNNCFEDRPSTGANVASQGCSGTGESWLKLIRSSNVFYAYVSADGVNWTQVGTGQSITMAQNAYIGLVVCSQDNTMLATATLDNASVTIGTSPVVSGVSPGLGATGISVTVVGSSFGASQGTSTLTFSNIQATSITSWSNSGIVALVPFAAPSGPGPVVVTVNSISSLANVDYTVIKPTIVALNPPGSQLGAFTVLTGSGFGTSQGTSQVMFNNVVAFASSWSDSSINVQVPATATNGSVTVTVDGVASNSAQFTVLEALTITGISPSSGSIGNTITVTGTGFGSSQSNSTLSFYGANGNVTSWSDTQIQATVPLLSSSGLVSVGVAEVVVSGPWFTLTSATDLTDSLGNPTTYVSAVIAGSWVPLSAQGSGCSSCTVRGTNANTFDPYGDLLTHTDELGRVTSYSYDSAGNMSSVSVPIGPDTFAKTSYTYNNLGEVLTTTDPLGNVTTNSYDAHGNVLTVTSPPPNGSTAASTTQFFYNPLGELTQITDPLGNVTKLAYYPAGLINTITDAQQNVTTYVYDAHGNRTSVTDAMNNLTQFAYDTGDRLKTITYPGSTGTTGFTYDNRGRRTTVTDQNSKTTTYAYDDADRLTTVTDAATPGNVTTYVYDTENNLTSIQDANNHSTTFAYDAFGRVTKTTFPAGTAEFYYYDAVGNLIQKTDRKSQTVTYTYDQLSRLLQKAYPDSTAVNYTYDNDSRLTQVTDPTGTYQFTFDNMGRLTGASSQYTFLTGRTFTTSYTYDAASNRTGFTDPESGSTTYVYDTLNRLQTLTQPAAFSGTGNFGFTYDVLSRRTQMTRPNGLKSAYAYDNLSRLLSVLHQSGATTLDGASYAVNNAGNRTSRTPQPSGTASNYGYDALYELTSVTQSSTTTESYTYDPVGNRLSSLGVSPYSNNLSNELTSTPSATYTYDSNGNTSTKVVGSNTTTYAWDYENRMTSVTLPGSGGTVTFKYDPFGRRIYKSSSTATSVYAYDGFNLIEETNSSGGVVARYEQAQNIDEPLATLRSSATSYFHADGLGSITSLSSAAGSIANTYTYDSYGNLTASTGSLTNSFRYTGREFDSETGLYYYRARYYDPAAGRFLREDPLGFRGGINKYAYVSNSAPNFRDPRGLCGGTLLGCAASLSQEGSLNAILPVQIPLLGSNFFGDVVGAFSDGPFGDRVDQGLSAASEVALHGVAEAGPHIAIGTVTSIGLPVSATSGVYNPITIGESTATLGAAVPEVAALATVLSVLSVAKFGADALVFAAALAICKWD